MTVFGKKVYPLLHFFVYIKTSYNKKKVSDVKLTEKFENGFKNAEKQLIGPQSAKNEGNIHLFIFFALLETIEKNAAICRTIGGHI